MFKTFVCRIDKLNKNILFDHFHCQRNIEHKDKELMYLNRGKREYNIVYTNTTLELTCDIVLRDTQNTN